jgi:hypothetical protein
MTDQPLTAEQIEIANAIAMTLKAELLEVVETARKAGQLRGANAMRDLRVLALRTAQRIATERGVPEAADSIYDLFKEMMGLK